MLTCLAWSLAVTKYGVGVKLKTTGVPLICPVPVLKVKFTGKDGLIEYETERYPVEPALTGNSPEEYVVDTGVF